MISLIINADDLGSNAERDRGILEAFNQGIVTSASLLANGTSFVTAVKQAKENGLPVGVHLNLSDGSALAGKIQGLTNASGLFPGKHKMRQFLADNSCDHTPVRQELAAQIERLLDAGLQPDHLDSHQHCHLFPCLTTMITELAREYDLHAMRTSFPAEPANQDPGEDLGKELSLYRQLGHEAQATTIAAGVKIPDGLWGMPQLNHLDTSSLCLLLENLPDGFWEIMTHPGYTCDQGRPFDGSMRQRELLALISAEAQEVITRRQIRLCTFGELPCAS